MSQYLVISVSEGWAVIRVGLVPGQVATFKSKEEADELCRTLKKAR